MIRSSRYWSRAHVPGRECESLVSRFLLVDRCLLDVVLLVQFPVMEAWRSLYSHILPSCRCQEALHTLLHSFRVVSYHVACRDRLGVGVLQEVAGLASQKQIVERVCMWEGTRRRAYYDPIYGVGRDEASNGEMAGDGNTKC